MDSEKPRSRRELREMEKQRKSLFSQLAKDRKIVSGVPRMALLGFLASITVVAPLSGLVSPDLSIAASNLGFRANETLLSVVASAESMSGYDQDLNAVPASARSRLVEAQRLGHCVSKEASANGDTQAVPDMPLLAWPMMSGSYVFASPWGMRIHPITGQRLMHEGVDLAAKVGTPIYAVADGVVTEAGFEGSTGLITVKHELNGEVFYSRYLHMYADGIYVSKGDTVKAGTVIAGVGSTGRSTGAHLHFEIRNPENSSVEPISWMKRHGAVFLNSICD